MHVPVDAQMCGGVLERVMPALGQHHVGGTMPTPFYDANDGFPDSLLRNDGGGRFTDITAEAGLAAKRDRRTFGASLIDLDGIRLFSD